MARSWITSWFVMVLLACLQTVIPILLNRLLYPGEVSHFPNLPMCSLWPLIFLVDLCAVVDNASAIWLDAPAHIAASYSALAFQSRRSSVVGSSNCLRDEDLASFFSMFMAKAPLSQLLVFMAAFFGSILLGRSLGRLDNFSS